VRTGNALRSWCRASILAALGSTLPLASVVPYIERRNSPASVGLTQRWSGRAGSGLPLSERQRGAPLN
jgi:hypothetical protein